MRSFGQIFAVGLILPALLLPCGAQAQNAAQNPNAQQNRPPPPPPVEPPFPAARGGNGPLQIPIEGITEGDARIAAGLRQFSLCWKGGDPPYAIGLNRPGAPSLVAMNGIQSPEANGGAVDLEPGTYDVNVGDSRGAQTKGTFTAVPSSEIPAVGPAGTGEKETLAQANALLAQGGAFNYEAYLRLRGLNESDPETRRALDMICHRPADETYAAGPAISFAGTELILSSETAAKNEENSGPPIPVVAYLTKANSLYAQTGYSYSSYSLDVFGLEGKQHSSTSTNVQKALVLLAYGLTDDITLGAQIAWSAQSTHATQYCFTANPNCKTTTSSGTTSGWGNPSFFGAYRVMTQSPAPGTLFLQSAYTPAIVEHGPNMLDLGAAFVRWQHGFALAGAFDANHVGSQVIVSGVGSSQTAVTNFPYWRETFTETAFVPFADRWGGALNLSELLPIERTVEGQNTQTISREVTISIGPAVSYEVVPQKLYLWLSYSHNFSSRYTELPLGTITIPSGANTFGVTLSSNALPSAIEEAIE